MNIALDIGHAKGTGARGNGLEEHDVACVIARHLFAQLKDMGHTVHVLDFPDKGNTEDLNATIKVANADGYDFGISLHCDCAHDRQNACGAHVCFYPGSVQGSRLAACIAEPLADLLPGRANTIQARPGLAVLKQTRMPWVLCECGFISNAGDADIMKHHPESIANAIAEGVRDFTAQELV